MPNCTICSQKKWGIKNGNGALLRNLILLCIERLIMRFINLFLLGLLFFSPASMGQSVNSLSAEDMAALRSNDPIKRYSAVNELKGEARLPEEAVNLLIEYLTDVRGEYPGNTIAGDAAEVLARNPQHAKRALPELMKLLAYTEKYAMPSGSAAKAIRAVKRVDLEAYLANLNKKERLEIAKSLLPVLENGIGSLEGLATISMILGMLGNDVAIPALESTYAYAIKNEADNTYFKEIRIRSSSAIKILKNEWKINELNYLKEMKAADSLLGKPDQYVSAAELFPQALKILSIKMKTSGVRTAYIIRKDKIPFDSITNGIPRARLAMKGEWLYLYDRPYLELRMPCSSRMILLTGASKPAYADDYLSDTGMQPSYFPSTSDYAFIEMGANGPRVLDDALKILQIKDGYDKGIWYEFWPDEWWDGGIKAIDRPVQPGKRLVWIKVIDGEIAGYALEEK